MAKPDVYARVEHDLQLGRTHVAITRLRTVVADDPFDLDARMALATIYRRIGNLVEAGRWNYLSGDTVADELAAFERAHPNAWLRLRLLRYPGDWAALPADARARLEGLAEQAARVDPPPVWTGPRAESPARRRSLLLPCLLVGVALPLVVMLIAIGLYRAVTAVLDF